MQKIVVIILILNSLIACKPTQIVVEKEKASLETYKNIVWYLQDVDNLFSPFSLMINEDNNGNIMINGHDGCNSYTMEVETFENDSIEIKNGMTTLVACSGRQFYTSNLALCNYFEMTGNQLRLYGNGKEFYFKSKLNAPINTHVTKGKWQLSDYSKKNDFKILEQNDLLPILEIKNNRTYNLTSGCTDNETLNRKQCQKSAGYFNVGQHEVLFYEVTLRYIKNLKNNEEQQVMKNILQSKTFEMENEKLILKKGRTKLIFIRID
ncbi:MAG: META domain-containing protein [Saprospiraceae bacterium]